MNETTVAAAELNDRLEELFGRLLALETLTNVLMGLQLRGLSEEERRELVQAVLERAKPDDDGGAKTDEETSALAVAVEAFSRITATLSRAYEAATGTRVELYLGNTEASGRA